MNTQPRSTAPVKSPMEKRTIGYKVFSILCTAVCSVILVGCASNPNRVRAQIIAYTNQGRFEAARNVPVKHNPGGIPMTDEEQVRNELVRTYVNPAEAKFVTNRLDKAVAAALAKKDFDVARDSIWTTGLTLIPEVARMVEPHKDALLREKVNIAQYIHTTNELTKAVRAAVARNDFAAARKAIAGIRPVRVWTGGVEKALNEVRARLVRENVPAKDAGKIIETARTALAETFQDLELRRDMTVAGNAHKPDEAAFMKSLDAFIDALKEQGCPEERRNELAKVIEEAAAPAFRALWRPVEDVEDPSPRVLGTTRLNELVAEAGKTLYEDVVVPAQIAFRTKELRDKVLPLLDAGDLDAARDAIHEYGITGYNEVDNAVFAVKLGLLNARVNPATFAARTADIAKDVEDALSTGDFKAAADAIAVAQPVPAYSAHVDNAFAKAASGAETIGVSAEATAEVVSNVQNVLYDALAPRPDAVRDAKVLPAYARELAAMGETPTELDWSAVRKALDNAVKWLVADDMPRDEANRLMADTLAAFQANTDAPAAGIEVLTTAELNRRLADFKAELSAKVATAVAEKMAADAKEQADAEAVEAGAEAERMRVLALEMAERAAAAVDFDARIAAFVEAVGDRVEPDMNRILGDGARVLRLRRAGSPIAPADASSLLVAAVYMGFDDVMNLALTLGADVDAPSPKDSLARPALLVALQYGWRGHAAVVLDKADRTLRDARGQGVVHYAVRGGNGSALLELLHADADTKTPDAEGATPLELAADLGYAGLVRALLPFSNPAAADKRGFTALLRAAEDGRLDIVRILAAADESLLGARTADGDGALELAALANAPDLLAYLLDERRIAPTERGTSQMVIARNVPTLRLLVAHGARLLDAHLAAAVKLGDFPMVKYLVSQGMDVNAEIVKKIDGPAEIVEYLAAQGQRP